MKRSRKTMGRGEIERRIKENQEATEAKEHEVEEAVVDSERVGDVHDSLDFGGTDEGADAVEQNLDAAQDTAVEVADERDAELEETHESAREHEDEISERVEFTESDRAKIVEAEHNIAVQETLDRITDSVEAIKEDLAFLEKSHEQAAEFREEAGRRQEELRSRIRRRS